MLILGRGRFGLGQFLTRELKQGGAGFGFGQLAVARGLGLIAGGLRGGEQRQRFLGPGALFFQCQRHRRQLGIASASRARKASAAASCASRSLSASERLASVSASRWRSASAAAASARRARSASSSAGGGLRRLRCGLCLRDFGRAEARLQLGHPRLRLAVERGQVVERLLPRQISIAELGFEFGDAGLRRRVELSQLGEALAGGPGQCR